MNETKCDLIVIGGGPGGIGAAVEAAKACARTLLVKMRLIICRILD